MERRKYRWDDISKPRRSKMNNVSHKPQPNSEREVPSPEVTYIVEIVELHQRILK